MVKKTSLKVNFIYNTAYQLMTILIPLVTTPYLSRVLGADGIGSYSYAYAIANYFVLFAMLGLSSYGNRSIAKARNNESGLSNVFCSIYALQIITSLFALVAYIVFEGSFNPTGRIGWIMVFYVLSAGLDVNWFFWGLEEFKLTATRNAIIRLLTTVSIFVFVKDAQDIWVYAVIMSSSLLISQIVVWPFVLKRITFTRVSLNSVRLHIAPNFKLFIPTIAVSIYKVMDKIMLGALASPAEVGFYESADKVIAIPICIVTSLGTVMLPRMSNIMANTNNENAAFDMIKKSMILAVALTSPLAVGLMAIADVFVPFFYGSEFIKCVQLFYILMPSCLFVAMANVVRTQYLIPDEHDREYVISCIVGAVVNLVFNTLLIPSLQSIGAAIGTLAAEVSVFAYQFWYTKKNLPYREMRVPVVYTLIVSVLMGLIVKGIPVVSDAAIVTIALKVCIGGIIYLLLMGSAILFLKKNKLLKWF